MDSWIIMSFEVLLFLLGPLLAKGRVASCQSSSGSRNSSGAELGLSFRLVESCSGRRRSRPWGLHFRYWLFVLFAFLDFLYFGSQRSMVAHGGGQPALWSGEWWNTAGLTSARCFVGSGLRLASWRWSCAHVCSMLRPCSLDDCCDVEDKTLRRRRSHWCRRVVPCSQSASMWYFQRPLLCFLSQVRNPSSTSSCLRLKLRGRLHWHRPPRHRRRSVL